MNKLNKKETSDFLSKMVKEATDENGIVSCVAVGELIRKVEPNFLNVCYLSDSVVADFEKMSDESQKWIHYAKQVIRLKIRSMKIYERIEDVPYTFILADLAECDPVDDVDSDEAYDRAEIMEEHEAEWTPEDQSRYEMFQLVMKTFRKAGIKLDIDHAKSLKEGGQHHPDNMQLLLEADNRAKGAGSCPRYMWETQKAELVSHINRAGRLNRFNSDTNKQLNLMIRLLSTVYHGF